MFEWHCGERGDAGERDKYQQKRQKMKKNERNMQILFSRRVAIPPEEN